MGPSPKGAVVAVSGGCPSIDSPGPEIPPRQSGGAKPAMGGRGFGGSHREGGHGFGVRGSAGERGWETCPPVVSGEGASWEGGGSDVLSRTECFSWWHSRA